MMRGNPTNLAPVLIKMKQVASSEPLRSWIVAHEAEILTRIAQTLAARAFARMGPPRFLDESISVEEAIAKLREWAGHLQSITYYEDGKMIQDDIGFNTSDDAVMGAYLRKEHPEPEEHLNAANILIKYARTQLGGRDAVIRFVDRVRVWAEGERRRIDVERAARAAQAPRQGATSSANAQWNVIGDRVVVRWARQPYPDDIERKIRSLGLELERRKDWTMISTPDGWAVSVQLEKAPEFSKYLKEIGQTELSDTLSGSASRWLNEVGTQGASGARGAPQGQGDATQGELYGGVSYLWDREGMRILFLVSGNADRWSKRVLGPTATSANINGRWYAVLFTAPDQMTEAKDYARENGYSAVADLIDRYFTTWVAASSLQQSREEGRAQGGYWKLKTWTVREIDRKTRLYKPVQKEEIHVWLEGRVPEKIFNSAKKWSVNEDFYKKGYRYVLTERTIVKFVDLIRPTFPRLAEALSRAFGGIASVMDEERDYCAPLEAMSSATRPEEVTSPAARAAIAEVDRAFAERGPKGLAPLDFQRVGIAYAKASKYRCLIADNPGLGKTIQGIGCVITDPEENLPCLVVAPANVVYNWAKEIRRWTQRMALPVTVLIGSTFVAEIRAEDDDTFDRKERKSKKDSQQDSFFEGAVLEGTPLPEHAGFVICSWDTMREREAELAERGFRLLIADEAHYAKDPKSARTKALIALAEKIPNVVLLTGTPFKNTIVELWSLLSIVNPEAWGKRTEFKRKFTKTHSVRTPSGVTIEIEDGADPEKLPELRSRMRCTMVRRLKTQVLKNLPSKTMYRQDVQMTGTQTQLYNEASQRFSEWLAVETERRVREALKEMGIDPNEVEGDIRATVQEKVERAMESETLVRMGELRQLVGRFKAPHAAKMVASLKEPVLLWCHHAEVVDALKAACRNAGLRFDVIEGDTPAARRMQIADAFQAGDLDVLICTLAAREGLTLTRAAKAIFVERYWSPADERQAEDRIYRIGQTRPVEILRLHIPDTIDDRMDELNEQKQSKIDQVLGDDQFESKMRRENSATVAARVIRLVNGRRRR